MNCAKSGIRALSLIILLCSFGMSQDFPNSIWVPVTFYDFHSDRSNPEFEAPHDDNNNKARTGMVGDTLDSDRKPVVGPTPYLNNYIHKWFRPFEKGDSTIPLYDPRANFKESYQDINESYEIEYKQPVKHLGIGKANHDTSFKNIVIKDSLLFVHKGKGIYEFASDNFFPLDNKGFGNEWNVNINRKTMVSEHNYSFTMELHYKFIKKPGLVFEFKGDDDVWVFVDNKLQMDLGGIHNQLTGSFTSDDLKHLQDGSVYSLDVFYAERHSAESHIRITTNFISPLATLYIYGKEGTPNTDDNLPLGTNDTVVAGEPFQLFGHLFDSSGTWQPSKDAKITWEITSGDGSLTNNTGSNTVFSSTKANTQVTVLARYVDSLNPYNESLRSITFFIKERESIYSVRLYKEKGDPTNLNPLPAQDSLAAGETYTIYGHVFDTANVWHPELDSLITWVSSNSQSGNLGNLKGESTSFTAITPASHTTITASFANPKNPSKVASKLVTLYVKAGPQLPTYEIRFFKKPGDPSTLIGTSDTMEIGKSYSIYAEVYDDKGVHHPELDSLITWDLTSVSAGTLTSTKGNTTTFTAKQQDVTAIVTAHLTDPVNINVSYTKSVSLIIVPAAQYKIKIYREPGNPTNLTPIGNSLTIKAGDSVTIYGHLFDMDGNWLKELDSQIRWKLIDEKPTTTITPTTGVKTTIFGTIMGDDTLVANFTDTIEKSRLPSNETVFLHIIAGDPYRIDIQRDSLITIQTGDDPFEELLFTINDRSFPVYAVTRDRYDNAIGLTDSARWRSLEVTIADISPEYGKTTTVIKTLTGTGDETMVIASKDNLIPDTIKVICIGVTAGVATPVPFNPSVDNIYTSLNQMAAKYNADVNKITKFYENVLSAAKSQSVTLIGISTQYPLVPKNPSDTDPHRSYGDVNIYDAVGNLIKKNLKLLQAGSSRAYGLTWDGTNDKNRLVGTGIYLITFSGVQANGAIFNYTMKHGIKRK